MSWKWMAFIIFMAVSNIVAWVWILLPIKILEYHFPKNFKPDHYVDALDLAVKLGRLDGISVLLTVFGILLGLAAIVGFGYFKERAEKVSRETTQQFLEGRETVNIKLRRLRL